ECHPVTRETRHALVENVFVNIPVQALAFRKTRQKLMQAEQGGSEAECRPYDNESGDLTCPAQEGVGQYGNGEHVDFADLRQAGARIPRCKIRDDSDRKKEQYWAKERWDPQSLTRKQSYGKRCSHQNLRCGNRNHDRHSGSERQGEYYLGGALFACPGCAGGADCGDRCHINKRHSREARRELCGSESRGKSVAMPGAPEEG